ncbi:MAG TPA: matrixin family metalloprotease [Pirellulaceae bacterium]
MTEIVRYPLVAIVSMSAWIFMIGWVANTRPSTLGATETVFVKILVDEEEATTDANWQRRLRERVERASAIIHPYARIRFIPREFGRWSSENRFQDFRLSLAEFEREVNAGASRLSIGFSSQYKFQMGRNNLGGTRGPLQRHILIRENAPATFEPERLEVLVHELGHFLGAAHSVVPDSVMRPVVADGQARAKAFQIHFDPRNAAILRLIGREVRDRNVRTFESLSPVTLLELRPQYAGLLQEYPDDPSAANFLSVVDQLIRQRAAPRIAIPTQPPAK